MILYCLPNSALRPIDCDDIVSELYARCLCLLVALGINAEQPVGQARRAMIGYLVYTYLVYNKTSIVHKIRYRLARLA